MNESPPPKRCIFQFVLPFINVPPDNFLWLQCIKSVKTIVFMHITCLHRAHDCISTGTFRYSFVVRGDIDKWELCFNWKHFRLNLITTTCSLYSVHICQLRTWVTPQSTDWCLKTEAFLNILHITNLIFSLDKYK